MPRGGRPRHALTFPIALVLVLALIAAAGVSGVAASNATLAPPPPGAPVPIWLPPLATIAASPAGTAASAAASLWLLPPLASPPPDRASAMPRMLATLPPDACSAGCVVRLVATLAAAPPDEPPASPRVLLAALDADGTAMAALEVGPVALRVAGQRILLPLTLPLADAAPFSLEMHLESAELRISIAADVANTSARADAQAAVALAPMFVPSSFAVGPAVGELLPHSLSVIAFTVSPIGGAPVINLALQAADVGAPDMAAACAAAANGLPRPASASLTDTAAAGGSIVVVGGDEPGAQLSTRHSGDASLALPLHFPSNPPGTLVSATVSPSPPGPLAATTPDALVFNYGLSSVPALPASGTSFRLNITDVLPVELIVAPLPLPVAPSTAIALVPPQPAVFTLPVAHAALASVAASVSAIPAHGTLDMWDAQALVWTSITAAPYSLPSPHTLLRYTPPLHPRANALAAAPFVGYTLALGTYSVGGSIALILVPVNTPPSASAAGGALALDGRDDGIDLTALSLLGPPITVQAWLARAPAATPAVVIALVSAAGGGNASVALLVGPDGSFSVTVAGASYLAGNASLPIAAVGEWTHVSLAATVDGQLTVTVQSTDVSTSPSVVVVPGLALSPPLTVLVAPAQVALPAALASHSGAFAGTIDEIRVWHDASPALAGSKLVTHRLVGNEANLALYLPLDELPMVDASPFGATLPILAPHAAPSLVVSGAPIATRVVTLEDTTVEVAFPGFDVDARETASTLAVFVTALPARGELRLLGSDAPVRAAGAGLGCPLPASGAALTTALADPVPPAATDPAVPGGYTPAQVLGEPNVYPFHTRSPLAWRPRFDSATTPLVLALDILPAPAIVTAITVFETLNPGSLSAVYATANGSRFLWWAAPPLAAPLPLTGRAAETRVPLLPRLEHVARLELVFDPRRLAAEAGGETAIDAVVVYGAGVATELADIFPGYLPSGTAVFTPDANTADPDYATIGYTVFDAECGVAAPAELAIAVDDSNDRPVALTDTISFDAAAPEALVLLRFADLASDVDSPTLTFTIATAPPRGVLYNTPDGVTPTSVLTAGDNVLHPDGLCLYTPGSPQIDGMAAGAPAYAVITFTVFDGASYSRLPGALTISALCPSGTARAGESSTGVTIGDDELVVCAPCVRGAYQPFPALTECLLCEPGSTSLTGSPACAPCLPGSAAPTPGASNCSLCAPGLVAPAAGAAACELCPPGTFAPDIGRTVCTPCSAGSYAAGSASASCTACPAGTTTLAAGAADKAACICAPGFYNASASATCVACPTGGVCAGGDAAPVPAPGYWAATLDAEAFLRCATVAACPGGSAARCAVGYTGALCASCAAGYARTGAASETPACVRCDGGQGQALLGIAVMAGLAVAGVLATTSSGGPGARLVRRRTLVRAMACLSLGVAFLQQVGVVGSLALSWGPGMRTMGPVLSAVSLDATRLPLGCALPGPPSPSAHYALLLALPLLVPAWLCVFYAAMGVRAAIPATVAAMLPAAVTRMWKPLAAPRAVATLLVFAEIGFIAITTTLFLPFRCFLQTDGELVLAWAPDTRCYSGAWAAAFLPLLVPAVIVYLAGIPLYLARAVMAAAARPLRPAHIAAHAPLFTKYQPRTYFWGLVELTAKVAITAAAAALAASPLSAALITLTVVAALAATRTTLAPFFDPSVNRLATGLAVVLSALLVLAPLHYVPAAGTPAPVVADPALGTAISNAVIVLVVGGGWRPRSGPAASAAEAADAARAAIVASLATLGTPRVLEAIAGDKAGAWPELAPAELAELRRGLDALSAAYLGLHGPTPRIMAEADTSLVALITPRDGGDNDNGASSVLSESSSSSISPSYSYVEYSDATVDAEATKAEAAARAREARAAAAAARQDAVFLTAALGPSRPGSPAISPRVSRPGSRQRSLLGSRQGSRSSSPASVLTSRPRSRPRVESPIMSRWSQFLATSPQPDASPRLDVSPAVSRRSKTPMSARSVSLPGAALEAIPRNRSSPSLTFLAPIQEPDAYEPDAREGGGRV
ncbi:uncharacterized protein AMSG_09799 [Thecamonas trahens ATCC 50062]|uniref:Tyrosine-protein kinase ephrin type A/B receptor-like domain-containing protein n=1 Tax=Thecamonas trahens ATCC 50062 TaxID=461836 RepID=A0A0L0DQY5_THETB|nr:hypothetical protein AMSG_09799 [Thecamonas trahens ATCC 50062]KNC53848.1 hypothetical protein AMSG_09799 [Thecamonas trahens ATCC 50062]|eukprot:XP_013754228.1 hypothetical protein AMSG_09799 [Thecamonas trahens ATCC 50062]